MTHELHFKLLPGEAWFGAHITEGYTMPITESTTMQTDTCLIRSGNQATPLFVSTKGRYLWSEEGYVTKWQCGDVCCTSEKAEITLYDGFETLRGAYLAASKAHFPFDGKLPNELMFKNPQYCTWIHLAVYQKQEDILAFAKSILDAGMPAGELIIDDGWQITFGHWDFDPEKFTDPKQMIKELHDLGFKVIMWICPFVSKKAPVYQWMAEHDMLVRSSDGSVASRTWWNGEDPVLDLSNPASLKWFQDLADHLMADYGVDGFKQDAGDSYFYEDDDMTYIPETTANDQSLLWAQTARKYEFNELRACFKGGGWGITQRLGDKSHSWDKNGLNTLIPNALLQGISGYPYSCPDMIGGGEISSFKEVLGLGSFREKSEDEFDTELLTRWCQCSALMPMMQFSFALWNLKNETVRNACFDAVKLHTHYADLILTLAKQASITGEPIIRSLEYQYPGQGFETVRDAFLLGENVLAAPVIVKGDRHKTLRLPKGQWKYLPTDTVYEGGEEITVDAPLEILPLFEKVV